MKDLAAFLSQHKLKVYDLKLLDQARTHSSYANESQTKIPDNQQLEFFGDSVLNFLINEYLFLHFPAYSEGELAQLRSSLVCEDTLAKVGSRLGIGELLRLGKGEKKLGGSRRKSNIADCVEAIIAALYLDQGLEEMQSLIRQWFSPELKNIDNPQVTKDAKSSLQELTQKYWHELPIYQEISRSGPDHHKSYLISVLIRGKEYGRSSGSSLKVAEQKAAIKALDKVKKIELESRY